DHGTTTPRRRGSPRATWTSPRWPTPVWAFVSRGRCLRENDRRASVVRYLTAARGPAYPSEPCYRPDPRAVPPADQIREYFRDIATPEYEAEIATTEGGGSL